LNIKGNADTSDTEQEYKTPKNLGESIREALAKRARSPSLVLYLNE
jgi:hypothetical protein